MDYRARIITALRRRFEDNDVALTYYGELLLTYLLSKLRPPHLVSEIETGDDQKFWATVWEAMLYQHLRQLNYPLRNRSGASGQHGPDFAFNAGARTVWVEAVVPAPEGIPEEWLAPPTEEVRVRTKPDLPRVLRCTSALKDKRDKFERYQCEGIVGPDDCLVIAVNICRLSDFDIDGAGISQLPLVMEPLFGFGPLGIPLTSDGRIAGPAEHQERFKAPKPNGAQISTACFYDDQYKHISAVIQAHQKDAHQRSLILQVIHNPNAANPLPQHLFGANAEYIAELRAADCLIKNIATGGP